MEKIAQRRKLLSKIREKINLKGRILEKLNPEFREMMDNIRESDVKIREYAESLKSSYRKTRSAINRRDYMQAAHDLSEFHEKTKFIAAELEKLKGSINVKHYDFLINQMDEDRKSKLFEYDPSKIVKLEYINHDIEKYAGLTDWLSSSWFHATDPMKASFHNIFTKPGIAMRALESLFATPFLRSLRDQSISMTDKTENLLDYLVGSFKRLGTAVAIRDIHSYLSETASLVKKLNGYHRSFLNYYNKNIEPMKAYNKELEEKAKQLQEAELAKRKQEEEQAKLKYYEVPPAKPQGFDLTRKPVEPKPVEPKPFEKAKTVEELTTPVEEKKPTIPPTPKEPESMMPPAKSEEKKAVINLTDKYLKLAQVKNEDEEIGYKPLLTSTNVEHGIPEGVVERGYSDIPFLAKIPATNIRSTPATEDHIAKLFLKRLEDYDIEVYDFGIDFRNKLVSAIKKSITSGWVMKSERVTDEFNPKDRMLTIYITINLQEIDRELPSYRANLNTFCRVSAANGTLTLRSIQKNFRLKG